MTRTRKGLSIFAITCFYMTTTSAHAMLAPLSLPQMYSYASRGDVRTLRLATQRGLNIDTTDRHGNTGLCYAILQNNIRAYNSFKAAGANPRHGCTHDIPKQQYDSFMARSGVYQESQTSREAYNYSNKGEYMISNKVWWIGGTLLVGAGVALALSGGGGGGGSKAPAGSEPFTPTNDSLSTFVGTKSSVDLPAINSNQSNTINRTMSNNNQIDVEGKPTDIKDMIDLSGNILSYTPYMRVAMKTFGAFSVENIVSKTITLQEATAGLVADRPGAIASNLGKIQMTSENATIGMISGNGATATNEADAEILMSFQGTKANHQIIGMYADTLGTIENKGTIATYSVKDSSAGKIIGMEGRLINQEASPSVAETTKLLNATSSKIELSATGDGTANSTNLIGMGSFLDSDFLDGKKLVRRVGYVEIENAGTITLSSNLVNGGTFDHSTYNIKKGSGIIGILADAHTNATNTGTVNVSVGSTGNNDTDYQHAQAGMLASHGGNITNTATGNINVDGGSYGYGMVAIRGTGANSEFDQLHASLINDGTITINSLNGYGMASYHGGTLSNNHNIVLEKLGTGIYANYGIVNNASGALLHLKDGGNGVLIDSADVVTTPLNTRVNNNGEIRIEKANSSSGIKISNGTINNNGTINLANTTSTQSTSSYGIYATKGVVNNEGTINLNVTNDSGVTSYGIFSEENADIFNKSISTSTGIINLTQRGTAIYTKDGKIENDLGKITLSNAGNALETDKGNILNSGELTINNATSSHGIKTNTGTVTNSNYITLNNANTSYGILSDSGNITNTGAIFLNDGTGSAGISSTSGEITNNSSVSLSNITTGIGINNGTGVTNNQATITISSSDNAIGIKSGGRVTNGSATNKDASIIISGQNTKGVELLSTSQGMDNYGKITVSSPITGNIYGINSQATGQVVNRSTGEISLSGNANYDSSINKAFGIFAQNGETINYGKIEISSIYGVGIASNANVTNYASILLNNGGEGIEGTGGDIVNAGTGTITISGTAAGEQSHGMKSTNGAARNSGIITINDTLSSGMYGLGTANIINEKTININGNKAIGMQGEGTSILNNASGSNIFLNGNESVGMSTKGNRATNNGRISNMTSEEGEIIARQNLVGMSASAGGVIINNGQINLKATSGSSATGMKVDGARAFNASTITVDGTGGTMYGIYASNKSEVHNSGAIVIANSTGTNYGIYASNSKVYNKGTITINGTSTLPTCNTTDGCGNHIKLIDGATLENWSDFEISSALNFASYTDSTSSFSVGKGGRYLAPEISGTVYASSSIVEDGFDTTYVNKDSFVGEDKGINLLSSSYLFDASLASSKEGSQDVVMTMKSFDTVVEDTSAANFLSQNYASQNGADMFALLKSANNQNAFGTAVNNQLGLDFFPSFARQNMEASKSLNREINNAIFNNTSTEEVSGFVGYNYYNKDQEASGVVQGYKENANSVYGVVERRQNNELSLGAGLSITQLNSKYDRGSKRDETIFNLYAPIKYHTNDFSFVSTPRIGYGFGDYKRYSGAQYFSADTKNYYYGIGNEVRKDIDLAILILEPTAELNVLGIHQAKTKESSQISVDSSNNLSIEGGLGLYAKKTFQIDEDNALKLRVGGTYYQEFNNAYNNSTATMSGMTGQYHLKGYEAQRYRALISSRVDYQYKALNFFGEASKLLEKDGAYELKMGISFNF